jgi:SAM-dependent methyltransferase
MSHTFADVDASSDPAEAVACQERLADWPAVAAYKRYSRELLGSERPVLDVGCGPGLDLVALGAGAVGVDGSLAMCRAAADRGVLVCQGDALALPFADGRFAGVRADRVLQHVADPERALAELVRVVGSGGLVVVADPDQESLVIEVPGVEADLMARVKVWRRDLSYRNGRFARRVPWLLGRLGMVDIDVAAFPLVLTDPWEAFGLPGWVAYARELGGGFSAGDERAWADGLERVRREGGFVFSLTFLVTSGRRGFAGRRGPGGRPGA